MKWFGISLQSQINISKVMLMGFAFVAGSLGIMSFTTDPGNGSKPFTDSLND